MTLATTPTTAPETPPADNTWADQFAALKARYPKVREAIVVALHVITQNPDISLDDAKAQAAVHGVRITAASINAARNLLAKQSGAPDTSTKPAASPPTTRRTRPATSTADPEALIRGVVEKLQAQADTDAQRLRDVMRKAIGMLQAAVDA